MFEPKIEESFKEQYKKLNVAYQQFAQTAARQIFKYLNNMHQCRIDVTISRIGRIKSYAPQIDHIVLDLMCFPA